MSNLRVIYDNAADRATLSSSATQTNLGVSNLASDIKSKVCRSTGTSLSLYASWPTLETIGCVANAFTNLSPTTTARIRLTNEASVTNLYKYTEQLDNSTWVKTACSVQPNVTTAPDGSLTAGKLVEDTTNVFRECYQSIAVTSGVTYTHSAYMKPAGRRYVQILAQSAFFGFGHVNFDLQTGTITATNTGATGTIEAAPNGYFRVTVTMTATATGTSRITTSIIDTGTAGHITSYQGDGVSGVYIWGTQIEVPSVLPSAAELVTNGTFSSGTSGWSSNGGLSSVNGAMRMTASGSSSATWTSITTVPGASYRVQLDVVNNSTGGVKNTFLYIGTTGNSSNIANSTIGTGAVTGKSVVFTAVGTTTWITVSFASTSVSGDYFDIDNVSVKQADKTSYYPSTDTFTSRSSTATYIASDGTLKSAASNIARLSYNPSNLSAPPKLLLEAAATNLLTYSETISNAAWTKTNVSVGSSTVAPDGNTTASLIVESSATGAHELRTSSVSLTSGTTYTQSVYGKASTRRYLRVGFSSVFGTTGYAIFDLQGGVVVSTANGAYANIQLAPSGFFRCSVTCAVTVTTTGTNYLDIQSDTTTVSYAGDGASGLYLWGAQLEATPYASSYILTTSATVPRSADVWTSASATRPLGYIDSWQSYTYDSGTILYSPAPYKIFHGMTQAQAASAYAYGGGKYACAWIPKLAAYGMALDIVDTNNLQGYVEVSKLICGDYWQTGTVGVDVQNTSLQVVDTSTHTRTDAGDLYTYVGTKHRKQTLNMPSIESASRKQLFDIMFGNGMSKPLFISLYPNNADVSLEANHMLYGKLVTSPSMSTPYYNYNAATIEIEEV